MRELLKEQFDKDGYVILKSLFSTAEVEKLKAEANRVIAQHIGKEGVFVGLALASPLFKGAAARPSLVEALKQIIGKHVVFLSDKLVYKNATTEFNSPWHQDYPYWGGSHKFSVWIALDDATPENGCLRIVPGSHLQGAINHGGDASDGMGFGNRLENHYINEAEVIDLPATKGDAIIFHDLLFHASHANVSGKDRWALISTYKNGSLADPEYPWAGAAFPVSE